MENILLVILGPTCVGKTDVSIDVAGYFNAEIISADSRQFYREMKIGTAVPSDIQLNKIRHHFVRSISAKEYYSASLFERDVCNLLGKLFLQKKIVMMTGGSGLYIDAVCKGIDDIPDIDTAVRDKYNHKFRKEGIESLGTELKLIDPEYYSKVDLQNHKRIIRALEIYETTGRPYSSFLTGKKTERDFKVIKIGLIREREDLYGRINSRVNAMIDRGLEEEARQLADLKTLNALNCVGYKEFFEYFEGKMTREKAIELIKRDSRRFAKRQITWWARDKEIMWFSPEKVQDIIFYIENRIKSESPKD